MIVADLLPKVLPAFKDKLIDKTVKRLEKMQIEVMLNSPINNVQPDFIEIGDHGVIESNTVIWTAGIEGSTLLVNTDDSLEKLARNRVQTDKYLRAKGHENVFVVGDNIFFVPEGADQPVPQMVENAEHSSAKVAKNIIATIESKDLYEYKPSFHGAMVCIGGRYGVAQVGLGDKQFVFSGFMAMFIKHFINFIYFIQVAGFNKCWTYALHEFFHVPDRRSFLGGHFSKRSPNFWLVPLRVFIGVKWFLQGWHKIDSVVSDPAKIFLIPSKLPDATTAASEAAEAAVEATAASAVVETGQEVVSQWGQALQVPDFIADIVEWSMDLMFYTPAGDFTWMASVFQSTMVFAEVIIGALLVVGLFTMPASVASIALGLMIWASGMALVEMLWYLIAGIATIGGSGSTFGLDYYVYPLLKKWWREFKGVSKW